jgi:hypothetical protein
VRSRAIHTTTLLKTRPLPFLLPPFHKQAELGDVVYVELPEVGSTVTKGETYGVVESVKVRSGGGGGGARALC